MMAEEFCDICYGSTGIVLVDFGDQALAEVGAVMLTHNAQHMWRGDNDKIEVRLFCQTI